MTKKGILQISNSLLNTNISIIGKPIPVKGQLITMNLGNETPVAGNNNQYRVLSISGSIADVVAMYDMPEIVFRPSSDNGYSGGELDTYLNTTFYSSLNSIAKDAIVNKNIIQYKYSYVNSVHSATHVSYADYSTKAIKEAVGDRFVYALDVEDIETYFNSTFGTADILMLFWNTPIVPKTPTCPWLRSADADRSNYVWRVYGYYGDVSCECTYYSRVVRPALTIDLSKIDYTIVK